MSDNESDACTEEEWDGVVSGADRHVASGADVARLVLTLPRSESHWGVQVLVNKGECFMRVQRQSAGAHSRCEHCASNHEMLIVQRICVREQRKGHGSQVLRDMLCAADGCALPRFGIWLQSVVTEGGAALARSLGMTRCLYDGGSYNWCRRDAPVAAAATPQAATTTTPAKAPLSAHAPVLRRSRRAVARRTPSRSAPAGSAVRVVLTPDGRRVVHARRADGTRVIRIEVSTDPHEDDNDAAAEAARAASDALHAETAGDADDAAPPVVEFVKQRLPRGRRPGTV